MEFYGGRAAPVWQIIFTGLRSAKGLVGLVPIDVNISDLRQPFGGVRGVVGILGVDEERHQRDHAVGVFVRHFCSEPVEFWVRREADFFVRWRKIEGRIKVILSYLPVQQ